MAATSMFPQMGSQSDMQIDHNWFHDVWLLPSPLGPSTIVGAPWSGAYMDGSASGWQVYQNVIWNAMRASFMMNNQNVNRNR